MPTFNTGDAGWDQGLNSLAARLFPDPSSIAQSAYYGAQARNQKLEADKLEEQRKARDELPGFVRSWRSGQGQVPGIQAPGGTFAAIPMGQPGPGPGPGPGAAPPGPMPGPVPGPMGQAAGPAPGSQPLPPYVPGTAAKLGQAIMQNGIQPGGLGTGAPPPMASPAPGAGAPFAPTATGSDGSIPPTDLSSGKFNPASITEPGGGMKQSGPAASDGSPAASLDLAPIFLKLLQAGYKGEDLLNVGTALIDDAYQSGVISQNTAAQALASMNHTGLLSAQEGLAQQNIVTGEAARQFNAGKTYIVKPNSEIGAIPNSQWLASPDAYQVLDPAAVSALATQNYAPKNVFAKGPDGKPDLTHPIITTTRDAIAGQMTPVPEGFSVVGKDTGNAPESQGFQRQLLARQAVERMYAAPPRSGPFDYTLQDPAGLGAEKEAQLVERALQIFQSDPQLRLDQKNFPQAIDRALVDMQQLGQLPTPEAVRKARARSLLGTRFPGTGQDPALMNSTDLNNNPLVRFRVDAVEASPGGSSPPGAAPPPGQGGAPAPQGPIPLRRPPQAVLPSVLPPAQGRASAGVPAPGAREKSVQLNAQGQPLIVHNGVAVPLTPAEMQEYQAVQRRQQIQSAVPGQ